MSLSTIASSSSSSRKQRAALLIKAMLQCLEENPLAGYNPAALRQMETLALELHSFRGPFGEKPGSIAGWASIYWSPRKYQRWDTVAESGADRVRQNILHNMGSLRCLNNQMTD